MSAAARKLIRDALALPEQERLEVAAEIIASLDGPPDSDWEATWTAELDRRFAATQTEAHDSEDWVDVRARIVRRIGRP